MNTNNNFSYYDPRQTAGIGVILAVSMAASASSSSLDSKEEEKRERDYDTISTVLPPMADCVVEMLPFVLPMKRDETLRSLNEDSDHDDHLAYKDGDLARFAKVYGRAVNHFIVHSIPERDVAEALPYMSNLRRMRLCDHKYGPEIGNAILEHLPPLLSFQYFFSNCPEPLMMQCVENFSTQLHSFAYDPQSSLVLRTVGRRCEHIQSIELQKPKDEHFEAVAETMPGLQTLLISDCSEASDKGLVAISKCCKNLRRFNMSFTRCMTSHGIASIVEQCHALEELDLGYNDMSDASLLDIIRENCKNLKVLRFDMKKIPSPDPMWRLLQAPHFGPKLQEFSSFQPSGYFTNEIIRNISQWCPNLKSYHSSITPEFDSVTLLFLTSKLSDTLHSILFNLSGGDYPNLDYDDFDAIVQSVPKLRFFGFVDGKKWTERIKQQQKLKQGSPFDTKAEAKRLQALSPHPARLQMAIW